MALEQALAGFDGPRNAIGDFIRSKLAEAKQRGLIKFQSDLQTQGALNIAQLKSDLEGQTGKQGFIVHPTGKTTQIESPGGAKVFPTGTQFITPREATSEAEKAFEDAKARIKTQALEESGGASNVIQDGGARGTATPVSEILRTQDQPAVPKGGLSAEERELLEALRALGG